MRLEQQVCSLELAKRLKELGVKQESIFFWERDREMKFSVVSKEDLELDQKRNNFQLPGDLYCSAFTVAELGEMLKGFTESKTDKPDERFPGFMVINVSDMHHEYDANEANCRAKMLIYLLENKLITV